MLNKMCKVGVFLRHLPVILNMNFKSLGEESCGCFGPGHTDSIGLRLLCPCPVIVTQ